MIYEFVTSQTVIARVNRDFNDRNWIQSSRMDLGDLIQEIGYATQRTNTCVEDKLTIVNHKVEMPCDLRFIEKIEDENGNRLPLNKDDAMLALTNDKYIWSKSNYGSWYDVKPPYIRTSFSDGEIIIFYRKYECDTEGFLLVPDEAEYRNALQWGLIRNLILQGYKPKNKEITFDYADMQYDKHKRRAKIKVKSMSQDERARFSRAMNSINLQYVGLNAIMDTE